MLLLSSESSLPLSGSRTVEALFRRCYHNRRKRLRNPTLWPMKVVSLLQVIKQSFLKAFSCLLPYRAHLF